MDRENDEVNEGKRLDLLPGRQKPDVGSLGLQSQAIGGRAQSLEVVAECRGTQLQDWGLCPLAGCQLGLPLALTTEPSTSAPAPGHGALLTEWFCLPSHD